MHSGVVVSAQHSCLSVLNNVLSEVLAVDLAIPVDILAEVVMRIAVVGQGRRRPSK